MWPDDGFTKLDLARHYADVAEVMVPHVRGRPLALQSFPHGIGGPASSSRTRRATSPAGSRPPRSPSARAERSDHVLANDAATLVYLAGQNVITPHVWTSRADCSSGPTG